LLVFGVASDGAAERAGVLVGDILLRFDDTALHSPTDLQDRLSHATPGSTASIRLLRGARVDTLGITVGERPAA
jgi:S1-C subfamily serine protease